MSVKTLAAAGVALLGIAAPAAAQPPDDRPPNRPTIVQKEEAPALALRPFVMGSEQAFAASNTFNAIFGSSRQPFIGGGVQVVVSDQFYVEIGASRFQRTGERAFFNNGRSFPLGLPLTASVKPLEITGGYRFRLAPGSVVVPYAGAGIGWYTYQETSPTSDPDEDLKTRHQGYVLTGGAEIKLHPWVRLAVDVQYTHVPGILGLGGVSQAAGEDDLGGLAGRLKLLVGR